MIKGIGTDIIEIRRFKKLMQRHPKRFLKRLFTEQEQAYCSLYKDPEKHFTARFAAKEAVSKALGTGFGSKLRFQDLSIINSSEGKPMVILSEEAQKKFNDPKIEISMSHSQAYATAIAVWYV